MYCRHGVCGLAERKSFQGNGFFCRLDPLHCLKYMLHERCHRASSSPSPTNITTMAWPSIYGLDTANLSGQSQTPRKPTILLVHDSFMRPAHFTPITTELTNAGFRILCPQLPSCTTAYKPDAIATDVQTVFQSCLPDLYAGHNILVVMSGYGGIIGSVVAARLNEHSLDRPGAGMVAGLMFVSAMVLLEGESFSDVLHATSDIYRVCIDQFTATERRSELAIDDRYPTA